MKIQVIVHPADEGGFWAEAPAIAGCASQGETMDELLHDVREAIEGCLSVRVDTPMPTPPGTIVEIAYEAALR